MYRLFPTEYYQDDISSVHDYINRVLVAPKAANELIDVLSEKLISIKKMPYCHALVEDEYLSSIGIRSIQVKKYLLVYVIDKELKIIRLVRFLDARSDWMNILKSELIEFEE